MIAVNMLREIGHRCKAGVPLRVEHAEWLRAGLDRFLRRECASLDEAFGLISPRGGVPWWLEEAIRERDRALRELAQRFYANLSVAAKARKIHALTIRYAASAWRMDRQHADMPDHYRGTAKQFLWRAFRAGAAVPVSERTLRNIVSA